MIFAQAASFITQSAFDRDLDIGRLQRKDLENLSPTANGRIDTDIRIFRGRPNQDNAATFQVGQ